MQKTTDLPANSGDFRRPRLNKIYLFVEGIDDVLFLQSAFIPLLATFYNDIEIIQYAQMKRIKTIKYIDSIETLGFDYLLLADIDQEPSTKHKKHIIQHRFPIIEYNKIVVVIAEIESWYLAGIPQQKIEEWGLDNIERTELLTKEDFNLMYGGKFRNRTDFMQEILKCYDLEIGQTRNESLEFFYNMVLTKTGVPVASCGDNQR